MFHKITLLAKRQNNYKPSASSKTGGKQMYKTKRYNSHLQQPYYTPFFKQIQAKLAENDFFVNYDKYYAKNIMLTSLKYKHLFLHFSIPIQHLGAKANKKH